MLAQLLGKVNLKRLVLTNFAVFAYIFVSNFIIHGVILKNTYMETASLWRPESEMHSQMLWMLLGQFLIAKGISSLFAKSYEKKGVKEGIRFGLFAAPLYVGPYFIQYAVTPIPMSLLFAWVGLGFIQVVLGGVVASLVYKR